METADEERMSPAMRRVLDLLLEGAEIPPEAMEALNGTERADLRALARTANLTRLALHRPEPEAHQAQASLARAEEALRRLGPRAGADPGSPEPDAPSPSLLDRLRRLLRVRVDDEG